MFHTRIRESLAIALVLAPLALLAAACSSRPPEHQFLSQFFRAARTRDNETLAMISAVKLDPRAQGEVSDFDITNVSEERRTPLDLKGLLAARQKAIDDEADFRKRRLDFESKNRPALEAIAKMERDPAAKFTPVQQQLKAEWDKWKADAIAVTKATAAARAAVNMGTGPAEASLTQPGQPAFSADKFSGDLISKDITLDAQVKTPDNQTVQKTLIVTIQRVEGTQDGAQRSGKPIVARIQGL
jgi:hypothetical protein